MDDEKQIKQGFFTMEVIRKVCAATSIDEARKIALDRIEEQKKEAKQENIVKATNMVNKAKDIRMLGISMTNFMFAHPSENLKTIR